MLLFYCTVTGFYILLYLAGKNNIHIFQQDEPTTPDPCPVDLPRVAVHSFCHVVTASNTSTDGGFLVLPKHATECLPPLVGNYFFLNVLAAEILSF